jgi:type I restriction enzyme, S subunit
MNAYPAYKQSEQLWLGNIPEHWNLINPKWLFGNSSIKNHPNEPLLSATQEQGVVPRDEVENRVVMPLKDLENFKLVENGDFVISLRSFQGGIEYSNYKGLVSPAYTVLKPSKDVFHGFYKYLFKSATYINILASNVKSIRDGKNISYDDFSSIKIPYPALSDQQAIANFLDCKIAQIDTLIKKKQRQIDLLQEQRTALINHAVTKGLNPNAPMKDSGIEWLGEMPSHWQVKKLKQLSDLQSGLTLGKSYTGKELRSRPYLRVANVQDGYLDLNDIKYIDLPSEEVSRYELQAGDVVVTEGGDFDKLGRGYVWEGQIDGCLHQNHIFAIRPYSTTLTSYYLSLIMGSQHGKNYFTSAAKQTTNLATTNSTQLKNLPIILPPLEEQENIIAYVSNKAGTIDKTIENTYLLIEKLQEYRTALISEAVTGKIDVREWRRTIHE